MFHEKVRMQEFGTIAQQKGLLSTIKKKGQNTQPSVVVHLNIYQYMPLSTELKHWCLLFWGGSM
jgi:hypothetical protein